MSDSHRHATMFQDVTADQARRYDRLAGLLAGGYRRIAADALLQASRGATVVDVGTGPGRLLAALASARSDIRVIGVDLAPSMVDRAQRRVAELGERASAVVADAAALPFDDGEIDLVVSSLSVHHWDDPRAAGAEVARVLRPGGMLRNYDLRHGDTAALQAGFAPDAHPRMATRFPLSVVGIPWLWRLDLRRERD